MKAIHMVAWILLVIGGVNLLLVCILGKDFFGLLGIDMMSIVPKIVYILVGLSAVYELFTHKQTCKMCGNEMPMAKPQM